jgi:uncharacterized protein YndB with AHSA1/START domain
VTAAEEKTLAVRRPSLSKTRDLRFSLNLKAKPEQVYLALTSARELCRWWLQGAETDARNMGRLRMVWPKIRTKAGGVFPPHTAIGESEGHFVDLEPGRKVAWVWKINRGRGPIPPLSSFFLSPRGRGTELTLLHAGFSSQPGSDRCFEGCSQGWEDCLAKLSLYVETGRTCKAQVLRLSDLPRLRRAK